MPTATKPKTRLPPIVIGMTMQEGCSRMQLKKKLELILSGDERRSIRIAPASMHLTSHNDFVLQGPYTIFEKLSLVPVEYREFSREYVPADLPKINPVLSELVSGIPKILNRNRKVNRSFYSGGKDLY